MARTDKTFSSDQTPGLGDAASAVDMDVEVEPQESADATIVVDPDTGDVTVDLNPQGSKAESDFDDNLALELSDQELGVIGNDLYEGIQSDDQSRSTWTQQYADGLTLLGFKLEKPRGDVGTTSSPVEGMSVVRHPLLAEAVLRFNANSRGEMLPASGPVKCVVGGDGEAPAGMGHNKGPSFQSEEEALAEALQKDMNYYLTVTATEYVPDSDRMFLIVGYGGLGYKKGYHCPIRRRPVIESVDPKDMIVSETATDIRNAQRATHQIMMGANDIKIMVAEGVYRDVVLNQPVQTQQGPIDNKINTIQGTQPSAVRPQDQPYTLWECRCKLSVPKDKFAPKQFKDDGIALPYRVTLEKESRQILEIRRDWDEEDENCERKNRIVKYFYVPGFGYYPYGLLHLLGNSTNALTAMWRECVDLGMFKNFPGGVIAKALTKQLTNELRAGPGSFVALDTNGMSLRDAIMPFPYGDISPGMFQIITNIQEVATRFGGTAEINVGEGKQDAPVGTTLALIEQATKIESAVHKRMHQSQSEEFQILKELFQEDPESFWRHNKKCKGQWNESKFLAALDTCNITPVADPNVPSHLHRLMKAMALVQLDKAYPGILDPRDIVSHAMKMMGWSNPESMFLPQQPQQNAPDPRVLALIQKAKAADAKSEVDKMKIAQEGAKLKNELQLELMKLQGQAQDRASQERQETVKLQLEMIQLAQVLAIHPDAAGLADSTVKSVPKVANGGAVQ